MTVNKSGLDFEAATLPHLDAAYNLAHWIMRERTAAEDVVQEAILRALTYFPGYRGENARAWLLQIVRNVAYAVLQKRRNVTLVSLNPDADNASAAEMEAQLADPAEGPEALVLKASDQRQLHSLLAALPVELRECLILKELEDFSYKEIAEITQVPVGTVMSRLWRARQLLIKAANPVSAL